ncbi:MAG TPA: hypothetical protein VLL56_08070 [Terriglobia bacterium]|nr:hypothetical protein [Terriglobia bacterium]
MPCRVGNDRRKNDRAHALLDTITEQQLQRRNKQQQHEKLSELDAHIKGQQRRQQVRARELQRLAKRE